MGILRAKRQQDFSETWISDPLFTVVWQLQDVLASTVWFGELVRPVQKFGLGNILHSEEQRRPDLKC
jgi:hypothetical protein